MRLIDADKCKYGRIIEAILSEHNFPIIKEMNVSDIPTAYDLDKVVKQLEKLKSLVPVNRVLDDIVNDKPKELGMLIAYEKAIEIVKGGGIDE